jgi:hypothetical protein
MQTRVPRNGHDWGQSTPLADRGRWTLPPCGQTQIEETWSEMQQARSPAVSPTGRNPHCAHHDEPITNCALQPITALKMITSGRC